MYKYLKFIAIKNETILFYWPELSRMHIHLLQILYFYIYFYKNINMDLYLTVLNYI